MRFIAINTAAPVIEILVVFDQSRKFARLEKVMAAEQLLPALDSLLDQMGKKLADFDHFVCVVGPGSFTGIRIGVNTVRAFAYALGKNAYGVTYNRVMAYNSSGKVLTLVDGGAGVCYVCAFDGDEEVGEPICIYKKDAKSQMDKFSSFKAVADYELDGSEFYLPDGAALEKAACYAINAKLGTQPLYIRKPQPERKENDI